MITKILKASLCTVALIAFTSISAQEKKVNSDRLFKHFDANGNGSITLEEFKMKYTKNTTSAALIEKNFIAIDTDKNGSLDPKEFETAMEQSKVSNLKVKETIPQATTRGF